MTALKEAMIFRNLTGFGTVDLKTFSGRYQSSTCWSQNVHSKSYSRKSAFPRPYSLLRAEVPGWWFSRASKIFLTGLMAASLHTSFMSEPEYPFVSCEGIRMIHYSSRIRHKWNLQAYILCMYLYKYFWSLLLSEIHIYIHTETHTNFLFILYCPLKIK